MQEATSWSGGPHVVEDQLEWRTSCIVEDQLEPRVVGGPVGEEDVVWWRTS